VNDQRVSGSRSLQDRFGTAPGNLCVWRTVVLRGRGVTLREAERQDALSLFTILSHPQIAPAVVPALHSPAELAARIESGARDRRDGRGMWLTVISDSGVVAGVFRVQEIEPQFGSAEWEFAVAHEQWGAGLFYRAAPILIDFVFDALGARRLEARAAMPNARSRAALSKLGAVQEAVLRQSVRLDGVYYDQVLLTLFADEWCARRDVIRKIH
jgi:N-acetyltransferase